MALTPGTVAPDFSLAPAPGPDRIALSDFRGKKNVVVLFMPLAFSGGCTAEVCQMAESYAQWPDLNAEILGITIDNPFVTQKFAAETGAGFQILSDFDKTTIEAWDVKYDEFFGMHGVAKRSAFVVDQAGVIQYAWVTEDADVMPPFDDIQAAVAKLS